MQNPFDNPAFNMASLTRAMDLVPIQYGRIGQLNLFPEDGVPTRSVIVEERDGVLTILPTRPPGADPSLGQVGKRRVRSFVIPHIPHDDVALPEEAQGVRAFGEETQLETLASVLNRKLMTMSRKHDITLEWLRAGALRGTVLDADNSVILNLFSEFGVTEKSVDFDFAGTPQVRASAMEVSRHMEDNLLGDMMTGIHALCSEGFWNSLIANADIKAAYDRWQEGAWLRQDARTAFAFAGIFWEEYRGKAPDMDGNVREFIEANTARFFPLGTTNTFATYFAPADFNETVNTIGRRRYAKQEPRKFNRGTDIHTQSNPLPICTRPAVLVKGTIT